MRHHLLFSTLPARCRSQKRNRRGLDARALGMNKAPCICGSVRVAWNAEPIALEVERRRGACRGGKYSKPIRRRLRSVVWGVRRRSELDTARPRVGVEYEGERKAVYVLGCSPCTACDEKIERRRGWKGREGERGGASMAHIRGQSDARLVG